MRDDIHYAIGIVLGQLDDKKKLIFIHYDIHTSTTDQRNYITTENEFLAVIIACDKLDLT
jgi:hypothetical protein